MNKYVYEVKLKIEIEAFSESDAWETLTDTYAVGENCGTNVVDIEYPDAGTKKK